MELIKCPNCNKEILGNETYCAGCGSLLQAQPQMQADNSKRKGKAEMLAIVIGFGAHNFYLGFFAKAIIQLLLTVVGLGLFMVGLAILMFGEILGVVIILLAGLVIAGVLAWQIAEWKMIKAQAIKTDAKGRPLV